MTQRWRGAPVPAGPGRHMAVPGRPTEVECSVECRMLGLQQSRRLHHAQRVVNERVGAPTHTPATLPGLPVGQLLLQRRNRRDPDCIH